MFAPSLANCHNLADLRRRAKAMLPAPMFHYIDGGADDEWSLRNNSAAFGRYTLLPSCLKDVREISMQTRVLNCDLALPFFLAPTGMSRLFHHDKELACARAAAKNGVLYSLSTLATTSLEDVAQASSGPKMFQIYILKDRELTREFVQRCQASGYDALCLTVDTPVAGNRERDRVNGMTMPPKIQLRNVLSYASSFGWLYHLLRDPDFRLANVAHRVDALSQGAMGLMEYANAQFDRSVSWKDAAWLAQQWQGPLVIKGLSTVADAQRAADIGATALMISNHGGRQLDTCPAPVDCVAPIREQLGDSIELIVDGGIRRATDIIKALALGADACAIGRPYLYGLAAGGQAGVEKTIALLAAELERSMALLGCRSIAEIGPHCVQRH